MPRRARQAVGGLVYHVLNRGNLRAPIFHKDGDYEAFERIMELARERTPVDVLAWCLMPNHWHLVLHPRRDGELAEFIAKRDAEKKKAAAAENKPSQKEALTAGK